MGQEYKEIRKSCDILIVGGGISGLTAAVSAKEKNPDASVIIVEKQTAGYGGKANKGGGVLQWFDPHMNPDDFLAYHVHSVGCYLGDQIIMRKYIAMNNEMIERMDGWGIKVPRQKIPTGPMTFMVGIDLDNCLKMAQRARKLGCEIIDKVPISDLLTDGNKVSGAVGYSLLDGTFYISKLRQFCWLQAARTTEFQVCGQTAVVMVSTQHTRQALKCVTQSSAASCSSSVRTAIMSAYSARTTCITVSART